MSATMNRFHFAEVGEGQWVGEESIFSETGHVNYTLRAKSDLVLLEISTVDLKHLLMQDYKEYLQ